MWREIGSGEITEPNHVQVIPKAGGNVRVVFGKYSGKSAVIRAIHSESFQAEVQLSSGEVLFKEYEHICKVA